MQGLNVCILPKGHAPRYIVRIHLCFLKKFMYVSTESAFGLHWVNDIKLTSHAISSHSVKEIELALGISD